MAELFYLPFPTAFSPNGIPVPGAKANFYATGTLTRQPIYSDAALTIERENPVVADSTGRFPDTYLNDTLVYRVVVTDRNGGSLGIDVDPYYPGATSATDMQFTANGEGAVSRSVESKLRDTVSVLDFGAVAGTSYAYNHEAFLLAAAAGGTVIVPEGDWRLEGVIATEINSSVIFQGAGVGTILRQLDPALDCVTFDSDSYLTGGGGLRNLVVEAGGGFIHGNSFSVNSTGMGVRANHRNPGFVLENIWVNNFANAIGLYGCWDARLRDFFIHFYTGNGVLIERGWEDGHGAGARFIGGGCQVLTGKISNNGLSGSPPTSSVALRVKASGGNLYQTIEMTSGGCGVHVDPVAANGEQVLYDNFVCVRPDTMLANGFLFNQDGPIWSTDMVNCWAAYCEADGVRTDNPNIKALNWNGGKIRQNTLNGWRHSQGSGIVVNGFECADNNRAESTSPYYDGFQIDANAGGITIANGVFSNSTGSGSQQRAVNIVNGTGDDIHIVGNKFSTGYTATSGVYNGSSGASVVIAKNTPRRVAGHNPDDALIVNHVSQAAIGAGVTTFLGPAGSNTAENSAIFLPDKRVLTAVKLYVNATPGAGQTFTLTARRNGVDTAITGQLTGTSPFNLQLSGSVFFDAGDQLTFRFVTSAGAAPTTPRLVAILEP